MKKTIVFLLTLVLFACALLPGCKRGGQKLQKIGRPGQNASDTEDENETAAPEPKMLVNPGAFSKQDVIDMGNLMNVGFFAEKDGWIYGLAYWGGNYGTLTRMRPDGTEQTKLSDAAATQIRFMGDWVYFLAENHSTGKYSVRRVKTSGEDEQILVNEPEGNEYIDYVFFGDGCMYYAVSDEVSADVISGRLVRCDTEGGNPTVILEKPVYYPYVLGDSILFQDDNDNSTLHRCDPDGKNDRRILDTPVYMYICDGEGIYYNAIVEADGSDADMTSDSEKSVYLRKCDLNGENREDLITDCNVNSFNLFNDTICYANADDDYRRYVYHLSDGAREPFLSDPFVTNLYYLNDQIFYIYRSSDLQYVSRIIRTDADGTNPLTLFDYSNK